LTARLTHLIRELSREITIMLDRTRNVFTPSTP
jgi:hypothetical protein